MKLPKIVYLKDFYSDDIKKSLNRWTLINYQDKKKFVEQNNNPPGLAQTTRHTDLDYDWPDAAYYIQNKLIEHFEFQDCKLRFDYGIVNAVNHPGCVVYAHKDNGPYDDCHTFHCNAVTKKPNSGGETIIAGQKYSIEENDLLCYATSEFEHSVAETFGTLRILWSFAFHVPRHRFYD